MFNFSRKRDSQFHSLAADIATISSRLAEGADTDSTSQRLADIETTVEALQIRQEQLKDECIRYLQRASQRMKRAEDLSETDPEETLTPLEQLPLPFEAQAEEDDRTWAMSQMRARGETPL
jgi:hypothetical protein